MLCYLEKLKVKDHLGEINISENKLHALFKLGTCVESNYE